MKSQFFVLANSALAFGLTLAGILLPATAMPLNPVIEVAQATTQLTEESVQAVVDQLQAARIDKDIDAFLELMAAFTVTVVTVETGNGLSTITTRLEGVDAHRQLLEQSFSQVQNRESLENSVTINVIDANFGIAKIYQMENFETSAGEAWIAASQTVLRLGRVDGQVLVTSATVDGWISPRPPQD